MKKIIAALAATALIVGFSAMNASAWGWGNGMMGPGMMYGGSYGTNVDQQTLDNINKIRSQMVADQTELTALLSSANPDTQRIRTLSEKISASQLALQSMNGAAGYGYGQPMMAHGMMNGGHGGCW